MKNMNLNVQEALQTPCKGKLKEIHIKTLWTAKDKEKILKAAREKWIAMYKRTPRRLITNFSAEAREAARQWESTLKMWVRNGRPDSVDIIPQGLLIMHLSLSLYPGWFPHYSPHYLLMLSESLCGKYFIISLSTNLWKFAKIVLELPPPLGLSMHFWFLFQIVRTEVFVTDVCCRLPSMYSFLWWYTWYSFGEPYLLPSESICFNVRLI